jgi:DNA-binding NarL/FixJ family response regulator
MRILIVEDDEVQRVALLRRMGARYPEADVVAVGTLSEAQDEIDLADVCVLDIKLGDAPVEAVIEMIYRHPDVGVVVYSGIDDEETIERVTMARPVQIVCKNCPPQWLQAAVSQAIDFRQKLCAMGQMCDAVTARLEETMQLLRH